MASSIAHQLHDRPSADHPPVSVAAIRNDLGVSRERMARLLDVSSRTIARWEEQRQLPSNRWIRQVLIEIRTISELGHESLTKQGFRAFMATPQPAFGDRSGMEMIERGEADAVYRELAGLTEGYTGSWSERDDAATVTLDRNRLPSYRGQ